MLRLVAFSTRYSSATLFEVLSVDVRFLDDFAREIAKIVAEENRVPEA